MDKKKINEIIEQAKFVNLLSEKMLQAAINLKTAEDWTDKKGHGYHSGTINNLAPEVSKAASKLKQITSSWG